MPETTTSPSITAPAPVPATMIGQAAAAPPSVPAPAAGAPAKAGETTQATDQTGGQPAAPVGATPPESASAAEVEVKLPAGMTIDAAAMGAVKELAKTHKLSSEAAQKFVDLHVQQVRAMETKAREAQAQQAAEWRKAIETDKELGDEHLAVTKANCARAFSKFSSPALVKLLDESGLGNHPEMVRMFSALGAAMAEDSVAGTMASGGVPPQNKKEYLAKVMYPNTPTK